MSPFVLQGLIAVLLWIHTALGLPSVFTRNDRVASGIGTPFTVTAVNVTNSGNGKFEELISAGLSVLELYWPRPYNYYQVTARPKTPKGTEADYVHMSLKVHAITADKWLAIENSEAAPYLWNAPQVIPKPTRRDLRLFSFDPPTMTLARALDILDGHFIEEFVQVKVVAFQNTMFGELINQVYFAFQTEPSPKQRWYMVGTVSGNVHHIKQLGIIQELNDSNDYNVTSSVQTS